jgi:hypothetical protein
LASHFICGGWEKAQALFTSKKHYIHNLFFLCGGRRGFFRPIAGGHTLIKINPGNLSFTVAA